ncbi:hypothetical protein Droror1_Dr00025827 [Drosera rotundifolia]
MTCSYPPFPPRPRCYGCCRDWEYDIYRCTAFFFGSFLLWNAQRYMPQIAPNRTPPPTPPHQNPSQPFMTCSCPPFPPRPRCYGCCRDWEYDIYRCIAFFFGSFLLWIAQRYMPERWRTPLQKFAKSLFSLEALNFVKAFMDSVWAWRENGEPEEIIADEGTTSTGSDLVIPTSVRHRQARSGRFFTAEEAIPHPYPSLYNHEMRIAGLVSRISCFARVVLQTLAHRIPRSLAYSVPHACLQHDPDQYVPIRGSQKKKREMGNEGDWRVSVKEIEVDVEGDEEGKDEEDQDWVFEFERWVF